MQLESPNEVAVRNVRLTNPDRIGIYPSWAGNYTCSLVIERVIITGAGEHAIASDMGGITITDSYLATDGWYKGGFNPRAYELYCDHAQSTYYDDVTFSGNVVKSAYNAFGLIATSNCSSGTARRWAINNNEIESISTAISVATTDRDCQHGRDPRAARDGRGNVQRLDLGEHDRLVQPGGRLNSELRNLGVIRSEPHRQRE